MREQSQRKDGPGVAWYKAAQWLVVLLAMQACIIFVGPSDNDDELRDLVRARARWNVQGVTDYDVVARALCFCGLGGTDVRVVVRNRQVISATVVATGEVLTGSFATHYRPVEQLFDVIEDAADRDAHRIDATYDQVYGYPTHFFIDYSVNAEDEEFGYEIVHFEVR
jgi:hypothetical protein